MDGFEFENCGNAVLKCEGKILGGVEKAPSTSLRHVYGMKNSANG